MSGTDDDAKAVLLLQRTMKFSHVQRDWTNGINSFHLYSEILELFGTERWCTEYGDAN